MARVGLRGAMAVVTIMLSSFVASPAQSGQAELDLLTSFIGNWTGMGALIGGKMPEPFSCRLTVAKGKGTKINYTGRCTLINMNLSVAGTIAFNENAQRYEAVMSSNVGFTGYAIGRKLDGQISFDLTERRTDRGGNDVRIGAHISLIGGSITVDYEVEFNQSGEILTASVPFSR